MKTWEEDLSSTPTFHIASFFPYGKCSERSLIDSIRRHLSALSQSSCSCKTSDRSLAEKTAFSSQVLEPSAHERRGPVGAGPVEAMKML